MDHDFGKLLQKARTDRGLSIEQAAAAVRIRSTFLRSLEAGDLTKFPNAAYAKSFLLMYGRYLGVDVKSIAVQIDTTTQMKVEGYQYLTNRAAGQPKPKADPELTYSAAILGLVAAPDRARGNAGPRAHRIRGLAEYEPPQRRAAARSCERCADAEPGHRGRADQQDTRTRIRTRSTDRGCAAASESHLGARSRHGQAR